MFIIYSDFFYFKTLFKKWTLEWEKTVMLWLKTSPTALPALYRSYTRSSVNCSITPDTVGPSACTSHWQPEEEVSDHCCPTNLQSSPPEGSSWTPNPHRHHWTLKKHIKQNPVINHSWGMIFPSTMYTIIMTSCSTGFKLWSLLRYVWSLPKRIWAPPSCSLIKIVMDLTALVIIYRLLHI